MGLVDRTKVEQIKRQAVDVGGCADFAELTAVVMAQAYAKRGRRLDAQRVLRTYLKRHPLTPRVAEALRAVSA